MVSPPPMRALLVLIVLAVALAAATSTGLRAAPQPERALARLAPAQLQLPPVSLQGGDAFALWVSIADLNHQGALGYDDDRDTVADRFVPSEGFGAFEVTLTYDPALLAVEAAHPGDLSGDSGRPFFCLQRSDGPGSFSFGCYSDGPEAGRQGSFTLAEVSFRPVGTGRGMVELEEVELSGPLGDDIPVQIANRASLIDISDGGGKGPPGGDDSKKPPGGGPGRPKGSEETRSGGEPRSEGGGASSERPSDEGSGERERTDDAAQGDDSSDGRGESAGDEDRSRDEKTTGDSESGVAGEDQGDGSQASNASDDGGGLSAALWAAIVAGGAVAAGGLGIAALRLRRP